MPKLDLCGSGRNPQGPPVKERFKRHDRDGNEDSRRGGRRWKPLSPREHAASIAGSGSATRRFISAFALRLWRCYEASMDRDTAVAQIRKACHGISLELMKINPAVYALDDKEAQDEIYRTVFELTKEVETIKKRLAKLERSDESRDL